MKKRATLCRRVGVGLLVLSGLLAPRHAAADLAAVKERGTLRVVASLGGSFKEFFSSDVGAQPGLEREILELYAAYHKVKLEVVPTEGGVASNIQALLAGRGDLVVTMTDTQERRERMAFTVEVFPIRHMVVTRKPRPPIGNVEALRQQTVGTMARSSWAEQVAAAGVPPEKVKAYPAAEDVLEALRSREVTAVVISSVWALSAQKRDPDIELGVFVGPSASSAFAVRKEDTELRTTLDDFITNFRKSGAWTRLVVKYFGQRALEVLRLSEQK